MGLVPDSTPMRTSRKLFPLLLTTALLTGALLYLHALDLQQQSAGLLSVVTPAGNAITVSNRFDGTNFFVQITNFDKSGATVWNVSHYDSFQETANGLFVDAGGNVYVGGFRIANGTRYFWVLKLSSKGQIQWERVDSYQQCTGVSVSANAKGDAWIAGSCDNGGAHPARLLHYDAFGAYAWAQNYDGGGRNYVRGLSTDFLDRATVTVEVQQGNYGSGLSKIQTIVYDGQGYKLVVY
jgi:hypothetical protein